MVAAKPQPVFPITDRRDRPAPGLFGGPADRPARFVLNDGRFIHPKACSTPKVGNRLTIRCAGGGHDPPGSRDRDHFHSDLRPGYITERAARTI